MKTWLIFGRTPELSWAEALALQEVYFPLGLQRQHQRAAVVSGEVLPEHLINRLGGLLRVNSELKRIFPSIDEAIAFLRELVIEEDVKEIGLSVLDGVLDTRRLGQKLKQALRQEGRRLAYRFDKHGELNSATSAYLIKHGLDILIIPLEQQWVITKTIAVQDIESWSIRDYGRPFVAPEHGMLPPKVARIMLNLAARQKDLKSLTVMDPFCGSGTVLMEAMLLGCKVIGLDLDKKVAEETRKNLEWIAERFHTSSNFDITYGDATKLQGILENSIDCMVTEPYLGPVWQRTPNPTEAQKTVDGLKKLYIGFLKASKVVLKPKSPVVLVVPKVLDTLKKEHTFSLVDICENLGYSTNNRSYIYSRPESIVKRQIWILENIKSER